MKSNLATAQSIMDDFAVNTGLSNNFHPPRRYLWTDAFAICNYLDLYQLTNKKEYLQLAFQLVDQVHLILGKHHKESDKTGWLSGLNEKEALLHPTKGGLRIGKRLNERQANEPFDERLEWDRDGQYFHYLTKWMYALNRVSQTTGRSIYNQWALELAKVAHAAFTYTPTTADTKRMVWKMSIDLSRPLVDSMGQHDPLDGLIIYQQLQATAELFPETPEALNLKTEISEMITMCTGHKWATQDSLGIGGLLSDANILMQLINTHHLPETDRLASLLNDIDLSLQVFSNNNQLNKPAEYRLAFRELGLSIGLHSINNMQKTIENHPNNFNNFNQLNSTLRKLSHFQEIAEVIEGFWFKSEHRVVNSWLDHMDINNVMLATSALARN